MSSSSESDSGRPSSPPEPLDPIPADTTSNAETVQKPALIVPAVTPDLLDSKSPQVRPRHDTQILPYGVPAELASARAVADSPTRTTPFLPAPQKPAGNAGATMAVPIKHITDRPKPDSESALAVPIKHISNKPSEPQPPNLRSDRQPLSPTGGASEQALKERSATRDSDRTLAVPIKRISDKPSNLQPSALSIEKTLKLPRVEAEPSHPISSPVRATAHVTAARVTEDTRSKAAEPKPAVEEKSAKARTTSKSSEVRKPPVISIDTLRKTESDRRETRYDWWATFSAARWPVAFGLVLLSLIVIYRMTKRGDLDEVPAQPAKEVLASTPPEGTTGFTGPTSEITSTPAGAEVVFQGTVIGTTPAKVERTAYEQLILVRKNGYESGLVRLSLSSEAVIHIDLQPERTHQKAQESVPRSNK